MDWEPGTVTGRLHFAYDRLDDLNDEAGRVKREYAEKKAAHEVAMARSTLRHRAGGASATDAKLMAVESCADSYREMLIAQAIMDANKTAIDVLDRQVQLLRTLAVDARGVI